jgi:choice-of-anchor B domain-containing protein
MKKQFTHSAALIAQLMFAFGLLLSGVTSSTLFADDETGFPNTNFPSLPIHAVDVMQSFINDHQAAQELAALVGTSPCVGGLAAGYPCSNVDLMSFLPLSDIGGGSGNDLWGWTDSTTGREYALMGRTTGTSFVDVSDPANPIYLGNLPTHGGFSSSWRDIKVYQDHAFIVTEANRSGLQVFDLTQLRTVSNPPVTLSETAYYKGFRSAHNIAINEESGYAYAVGTNDCSGGLHMINIQNPGNPVAAGCYSGDGYTHDAQCVNYSGPDVNHQGQEICFNYNEDTLTIINVTDKNNPSLISRTGYTGASYTHQGWLTDDQAYLLLGDEGDEQNLGHGTRTYVWDMSDLSLPVHTGTFTNSTPNIDHNIYIKGNFAYQASYRGGLRILDISDIGNANLSEAAYFDIYPSSDAASFNGAWSNYPYFASGTVIVSGIEQGLYVLSPTLDLPPGDATPTANIVTPVNGATVAGSVLIQIDANDVEDVAGSLAVIWNISGGANQAAVYNSGTGNYEATWDSTLIADGGYTINATATDSMNQTGSDSNNVLVDNVIDPTLHVGDLDGTSLLSGPGGKWNATVTVTVHDYAEATLSNATVTGSWGSCVTTATGSCSITQNKIGRNTASVTFTVDSVVIAGAVYAATDNHDPDGDSDGTNVTVLKP